MEVLWYENKEGDKSLKSLWFIFKKKKGVNHWDSEYRKPIGILNSPGNSIDFWTKYNKS